MDETIRWTVKVSQETDRTLRTFLGKHGMKKGDLSKFIERAVQKEILVQTAADVKELNADLSDDELEALIQESVLAKQAEMRPKARVKLKTR